MSRFTVTAHDVTPSSTGVAGWDVDVEIKIGRLTLSGAVTLQPSRANDGAPESWGHADHWIEGNLLSALRGMDSERFVELLRELEAAAAAEIKRSGVEPAKGE